MNNKNQYVGGHQICVLRGDMNVQHDVFDWIILFLCMTNSGGLSEKLVISNNSILRMNINCQNLEDATSRLLYYDYSVYQCHEYTSIMESKPGRIDVW